MQGISWGKVKVPKKFESKNGVFTTAAPNLTRKKGSQLRKNP